MASTIPVSPAAGRQLAQAAALRVALPALIILAALWPFLNTPFSDNEGIFGTVALAMSQGKALYTQAWDHKPPLVFLLYQLVRFLFGEGEAGLHWAAMLFHLWTALALGRLLRSQGASEAVAVAGSCLYSLFLFSSWLQPWTLQAEVLQAPFIVESVILARSSRRSYWMLAGAAWAAAFFIKQNAIVLIALYPFLWRGKEGKWSRLSDLLLGANACALVVAAPFALTGRLQEFWIAVSAYNLHGYLPSGWKTIDAARQAGWLTWGSQAALDYSGVLALLAVWAARRRSTPSLTPPTPWLAWLSLSVLGCLVSGYGHGYYFLAALAPLAGLAALALSTLTSRSKTSPVLLLSFLALPFLLRGAIELSQGAGRTVLARQYGSARFDEAKALGAQIRALAKPGDDLLVWGQDAQIYAYAGIAPSTARTALISHSYFLPGELERLEAKLRADHPRFIVTTESFQDILEMPRWLKTEIQDDYLPGSAVIGGGTLLWLRK